ncbi:hypothetical protein DFH08DRAFT_890340 [Mycena albidolilacea]|uniref:DUF6534 domain-containing protein n=1 Tax=Mycena albidolilacea TaxID=1033008 RepID=A0AAD6ZFM7_9AGAR|nr:hypothetical protein DFH08DRAFT_890340 [Mycena albidolilacea]
MESKPTDHPIVRMASPLAPTLGVWMIAQLFQAILYGMGLLQVYLYFLWYNDRWWTKGAVILVTIFETLQTGFFFAATYDLFIDNFGVFGPLQPYPWQAVAQLLCLTLSTFVAQEYFAYGIYLLHKRTVIFPLFLAALALASLGAGIAQTTILFKVKVFAELDKTSTALNAQAGLALACDVFITAGLCWRLNVSRSGIQSTNKLINFLIVTALNRGVLTMVTAALNIVFFLTKPTAFYFIFMNVICGKFYMNSMLAMLNTRDHAHSLARLGTSISMSGFSANNRNQNETAVGVNVTVTKVSDEDQHPHDGKLPAF